MNKLYLWVAGFIGFLGLIIFGENKKLKEVETILANKNSEEDQVVNKVHIEDLNKQLTQAEVAASAAKAKTDNEQVLEDLKKI